MSACIDEVASSMSSNHLQLNAHKTEMLWCASPRRQSQLSISTFRVCTEYVTPSTAVRDLGIYIDSDISIRSQVSRSVSHCVAVTHYRRLVSQSVFQSLVPALVLTKLDFGNATLAGIASFQLDRLQAVMNARLEARLVFQTSRYDHITMLHRRLHWLRVP